MATNASVRKTGESGGSSIQRSYSKGRGAKRGAELLEITQGYLRDARRKGGEKKDMRE